MPEDIKESDTIVFKPKKCPTCKSWLTVKHLGVWGYYCTDCLMWWGTFDPYPKIKR